MRAEVTWCLLVDLPERGGTWTDSMEPVGEQQHPGKFAPTPKLPQRLRLSQVSEKQKPEDPMAFTNMKP